MQKGYKREAKGMAILRCFFGLFVVIIVVLLASFMLKLDYADKLAPDASVRPYVETTPAPSLSPDDEQPAALADLSTGTPEPTPKPTATPAPKPTATPEPTAVPTSIPESAFAPIRTDLTFPETPTTDKAVLGVTHSYRSEADNLAVMQLQGYAYIDDASFDGSTAQLYLVLKRARRVADHDEERRFRRGSHRRAVHQRLCLRFRDLPLHRLSARRHLFAGHGHSVQGRRRGQVRVRRIPRNLHLHRAEPSVPRRRRADGLI